MGWSEIPYWLRIVLLMPLIMVIFEAAHHVYIFHAMVDAGVLTQGSNPRDAVMNMFVAVLFFLIVIFKPLIMIISMPHSIVSVSAVALFVLFVYRVKYTNAFVASLASVFIFYLFFSLSQGFLKKSQAEIAQEAEKALEQLDKRIEKSAEIYAGDREYCIFHSRELSSEQIETEVQGPPHRSYVIFENGDVGYWSEKTRWAESGWRQPAMMEWCAQQRLEP
ncbi:MAG: hypothetical protein KTR21_13380 [Rhodobacteraceae bacterium]|nr:hypothetical protein [Paracoccaceae bacterium]